MADLQESIRANVKEHGWHTQAVGGDHIWPKFTYSIGWGVSRSWPEVVIIGQRMETSHMMLSELWESNITPTADVLRQDILPGYGCQMRTVDLSWYDFLFGAGIDFYTEASHPPFKALQCVWPTTSGVLPWDQNAPEGFDKAQPLVYKEMLKEPGS